MKKIKHIIIITYSLLIIEDSECNVNWFMKENVNLWQILYLILTKLYKHLNIYINELLIFVIHHINHWTLTDHIFRHKMSFSIHFTVGPRPIWNWVLTHYQQQLLQSHVLHIAVCEYYLYNVKITQSYFVNKQQQSPRKMVRQIW